MLPEGWAELVALLDGHPVLDPVARMQRLCRMCADSTETSGVSVGLRSSDSQSTVCATDDRSDRLEELQSTLGEGPSIDAMNHGRPVLVSDLAGAPARRWPWFAPAAVEVGARAVFALPLRVGAVRIGMLTLYRSSPGELSDEQLRRARAVAEAASILLTLDQTGDQAAEAFVWVLGDRSRFHAQVHQAVGVTMVQLELDAKDAYARICAHAYAQGSPIGTVAQDIVAGRLRLETG